MSKNSISAFVLIGGLWLAACGGPPASPTAIPANVIRPQQSTPVYAKGQPQYLVSDVTPTVIILPVPAEQTPELPPETPMGRLPPRRLLMKIPPSALGIAPNGATIFDAPEGKAILSLPAGASLTVTGRSADGKYLAVYTSQAIVGWTPATQLRLFGADDLTVVDEAVSPAPVATLLAEAMQPPAVSVLDAVMTTLPRPQTPSVNTPSPLATTTPQP
jgi:hypothetical protein